MLELAQLLHVPQVHPQFDISPNDLKLAFAWNKIGEGQIYEMDLDTSSAARLVTVGIGGKFSPRYSPDGTRLAYVLDMMAVKVIISLSLIWLQTNTKI